MMWQPCDHRLTPGVVHGVPVFDDDAAEMVEEAEEFSLNQQGSKDVYDCRKIFRYCISCNLAYIIFF